jgi:SAM-dependent MidA family methyltransferase
MTGEGPIEVGVRRVPELDPRAPLPPSDPDLTERIRSEIRRSGPITFARFMELALYDPAAGYYTSPPADDAATKGPGRGGDFLTGPEGHPIFGWAVARHLESVWEALDRPPRFIVREHGAGTGALAAGILDGLRRASSDLLDAIRYQPIDASPARLDALGKRIDGIAVVGHLEAPTETPEPGIVLANELLDALPVHLVEGGPGDELLEQFVAFEPAGGFTSVAAAPSTPALEARLEAEGVRLQPGQQAAVCLAIDDWIAAAAVPLARGELLLIDYGHPAAELYQPGRGTTLRAYHRHRVHDDAFVAIGRQDLTAHVDLTAVDRAATREGLEPLGWTTQATFLANLGLGELLVGLQEEPATTLEDYLAARSAVARMLDPRATGAFAVLAFGRGLAAQPALRGFDPARGSARSEPVE